MEAEIAQKLIPRLIDAGVEYHCRRGLRDCWCEYCQKKWEATQYIANCPSKFHGMKWRTVQSPYFNYPLHELVDQVSEWREEQRQKYHEKLEELKTKVL